MIYLALFFSGAFLCNAIPHLVAGVQGVPFPTPFAEPPGVGKSPPLVNFLWGSLNIIIGLGLLSWFPVSLGANLQCLALAAGVLIMGSFLAHHFGTVRR